MRDGGRPAPKTRQQIKTGNTVAASRSDSYWKLSGTRRHSITFRSSPVFGRRADTISPAAPFADNNRVTLLSPRGVNLSRGGSPQEISADVGTLCFAAR